MTKIVLVRHGETTWHVGNRYAGGSDVPLSARGHEQARRLAEWARTAGLAGVWTSDLSRTWNTAVTVASRTGLEPQADGRLREVDFGAAEGLTPAEIQRELPREYAAFLRDPVAHHLPGGEDPRRAAERGTACLREIAAAHPDDRVLVVCHSTLIRLMVCGLLGIPLGEYRRVLPHVHNGRLNEIRLGSDRTALLSWNAPAVPVLEETA